MYLWWNILGPKISTLWRMKLVLIDICWGEKRRGVGLNRWLCRDECRLYVKDLTFKMYLNYFQQLVYTLYFQSHCSNVQFNILQMSITHFCLCVWFSASELEETKSEKLILSAEMILFYSIAPRESTCLRNLNFPFSSSESLNLQKPQLTGS